MSTTPTVKLRNPNWKFGDADMIGFAERLNIVQPGEFENEPTLPFGLCRCDNIESAEDLVIDEEPAETIVCAKRYYDECYDLPAWMNDLLVYLEEK